MAGKLVFRKAASGSGKLLFQAAEVGAAVRAIVLRNGALAQARDDETNMYPAVHRPGSSAAYLALTDGVLREVGAGETVIV